MVRTSLVFALGIAASLALTPPLAARAADGDGGPLPSYASQDQQIRGRVSSFDGHYHLEVRDDKGYIDTVELHDGTIINPRGLTLATGLSVTILGRGNGKVFDANEIDTPYQEDPGPSYGNDGGYDTVVAVPAYGYGCCYGYGYGYGYGGVGFSLGFGGYYGGYGRGYYGYGYNHGGYGYNHGGYGYNHGGYGYNHGGYGYNHGGSQSVTNIGRRYPQGSYAPRTSSNYSPGRTSVGTSSSRSTGMSSGRGGGGGSRAR